MCAWRMHIVHARMARHTAHTCAYVCRSVTGLLVRGDRRCKLPRSTARTVHTHTHTHTHAMVRACVGIVYGTRQTCRHSYVGCDLHNNAAHCVSIQTWIPVIGFRATHALTSCAVVVDFDVYESIDVARYRHTLNGARQRTTYVVVPLTVLWSREYNALHSLETNEAVVYICTRWHVYTPFLCMFPVSSLLYVLSVCMGVCVCVCVLVHTHIHTHMRTTFLCCSQTLLPPLLLYNTLVNTYAWL